METSISKYFSVMKDPRIERNRLYPLYEILLVGLCSIICGGEGFHDMVLYGKLKIELLRKISPFKNGIPSEDTFGRVFSLLDPKIFRGCFIEWVKDLQKRVGKCIRIAIDGKANRRTYSKTQEALHMVSAFAVEEGLVLCQEGRNGLGQEISCIEDILEILDLKNAIVTIDAIGCQKSITKRIIEKGGDYAVSLKDNQLTLKASVEEVFMGERKVRFTEENLFDVYETIEKGHGRIETRKCRAIGVKNLPIDVAEWVGIQSLVEIESTRDIKGKVSIEKRFYISSLPPRAKELASYIRGHWGIENKLHWLLDVVLKEDASRIRTKNGPKNLATLRHAALNLVKQDPAKGSFRGKLKQAGWNDDYLLKILSQNF
jgi:predicted transposase YbfD/YdcC